MRLDEARHDHRILELSIDLHLLIGDPALDLIEGADAEDLTRHGLRVVGVPGSSVTMVFAV
jgi:hypothetical protein